MVPSYSILGPILTPVDGEDTGSMIVLHGASKEEKNKKRHKVGSKWKAGLGGVRGKRGERNVIKIYDILKE